MNELIPKCENALSTVDKYFDAAVEQVKKSVIIDGKISINDLKKSLLNPNDTRHRFMVPSSGLHLWKIKY